MKKTILLFSLLICVLSNAQLYERVEEVELLAGFLGNAAWCDFNADGYLDFYITGLDYDEEDYEHAMIYLNNGDNTFRESDITNIPRTLYGDATWGDYDNNGTPDLLMCGYSNLFPGDMATRLYNNNGSSLVEAPITIPQFSSAELEWVDINNDGLLDIYYHGNDTSNDFSLGMLQNIGGGLFTPVDPGIDIISGGRGNFSQNKAIWADFDNDGLKDAVIAMSSRDEFKLGFYKNQGNFQLEELAIGLPQLNYVQLATGDLNCDGLMDLVFTGSTSLFLSSCDIGADLYIYINNGDLTFRESIIYNVGVFKGMLQIVDLNNDGYSDIIDYGTGIYNDHTNFYFNNMDETFTFVDPHLA